MSARTALKRKRPLSSSARSVKVNAVSAAPVGLVKRRPALRTSASPAAVASAPAAASSSTPVVVPRTAEERQERRERRRERKAAWKATLLLDKDKAVHAAAPSAATATRPKKKARIDPRGARENDSRGGEENGSGDEGREAIEAEPPQLTAAPSGSAKLMKNPQVFLDFAIDGRPAGRVVIELYEYASPRTVANFRALCSGERGVGRSGARLHFAGSRVHRVVPAFVMQMGDIVHGDGTGGDSIYGPSFPHEPSHRRHSRFGTVSTAAQLHSGALPTSQFFIALSHTPLKWLDGLHTVFGQVVEGKAVLKDIERQAGTKSGAPKKEVTIAASGNMRKRQRREQEEERQRRKDAAEAATTARDPPPTVLCERCDAPCRYNKKTRRGVRMRCTDARCGHAQWAARLDWTDEQKDAFRQREEQRIQREAAEAAQRPPEDEDDEGDSEQDADEHVEAENGDDHSDSSDEDD